MRTVYRRKETLKYPSQPWVLNRNDVYNIGKGEEIDMINNPEVMEKIRKNIMAKIPEDVLKQRSEIR